MMFKREIASAILRELLSKNTSINEGPGVSRDDLIFHTLMLRDAGLVLASKNHLDLYEIERITWLGYARLTEFDEALGKEFDPKNFVRFFQRA